LPGPGVSVGSTPTGQFATNCSGVTEVRAGVFAFVDVFMAGLGGCSLDDIALSVLSTVIGHKKDKGWIIIDAGWMALSRDRGTASQPIDQGYGIVCDTTGKPFRDLIVTSTNQEHGIITVRPGSEASVPDLPVGTMVRVFPNHACATASQHSQYHVTDSETLEVHDIWPRFSGW